MYSECLYKNCGKKYASGHIYCNIHRLRKCIYKNCNNHAIYNIINNNKKLFCKAHKLDFCEKKCALCNSYAKYKFPDLDYKFCFNHSDIGMFPIDNKICITKNCNRLAFRENKCVYCSNYCNYFTFVDINTLIKYFNKENPLIKTELIDVRPSDTFNDIAFKIVYENRLYLVCIDYFNNINRNDFYKKKSKSYTYCGIYHVIYLIYNYAVRPDLYNICFEIFKAINSTYDYYIIEVK